MLPCARLNPSFNTTDPKWEISFPTPLLGKRAETKAQVLLPGPCLQLEMNVGLTQLTFFETVVPSPSFAVHCLYK